MKWVTRANVKVDRVACPWLIRTFIDRDAEFLFIPVAEVESVARKTGAIPYDVAGVQLGHHGEECSFDAIRVEGTARRSAPRGRMPKGALNPAAAC